jgi:hypothetical protein
MEATKRYAQFLTSPEFRRLQQIIAEDFGFNLDVIKNQKGVSLTV